MLRAAAQKEDKQMLCVFVQVFLTQTNCLHKHIPCFFSMSQTQTLRTTVAECAPVNVQTRTHNQKTFYCQKCGCEFEGWCNGSSNHGYHGYNIDVQVGCFTPNTRCSKCADPTDGIFYSTSLLNGAFNDMSSFETHDPEGGLFTGVIPGEDVTFYRLR